MSSTGPGKHRHLDSRGKWTTDKDPDHVHDETSHPADVLTADQVSKLILIAAGGGGTTPQPPNTPPTIPNIAPAGITVSVTTTTAVISWTTTDASTGLVQYGTTTTYGSSTASTSSGTTGTRTLTSLTPGQSYHFRVQTTSGSTVAYSSDRTFTTTAVTVPPAPPGAPTNLVATGGNTQIVLTWSAPSSTGGSAITGYHVYRNGASLVTLGNVLTYTNTGLTNGITYTYAVAAITAIGEGPQSSAASATPAASGDVNPPVISGITISGITTTGATVSWTLNEGGTGQIDYGPTSSYGLQTTLEPSYLTAHSQSITGLTPGATYHFRVRSADAAGNLALSTPDRTFTAAAVTPPPPPPPSGSFPADTTLSYVALNADGDPGYLVQGTDSTWGTKYRRITNTTPWRNLYPKQMVENLDGSILFLGFGFRFLDGTSYTDLGQHATGVEYPVWSNVNRDYMYGCSDGQNTLKRFSVAANNWSVRHTFGSYGHLSLGNYEGNISATDTRIALIYNTNAARTGTWGVVIYDPVNDVVVSSLSIGTGGTSEPNNCNISRSGNYVTVQHGADGGGTFQGTRLYNSADFSSVRSIQGAGQARSHGDMLRDASGADIYVYAKSNNAVSHRLSDGTETTLLPAGNALFAGSSGHVSGQAINRDGWVYLSGSGTNTTAGRDQLIAAKTDGSQTVEVFGFAHCAPSEPLMAPNRDGTKVFYGRPVSGSMYGWVAGVST